MHEPQILYWIRKMFNHAKDKKWYETYWFIDFHGVISKPDYNKKSKTVDYYPYVKETLQYITKNRPDIILILFTSSYPDEIKTYMKIFNEDNICFKYINENPEISKLNGSFGCYDKKPYYNVLIDDKCGFEPTTDWNPIYKYFKKSKYTPDSSWSTKTVEKYHAVEDSKEQEDSDYGMIIKYFIAEFGDNFSLTQVVSSPIFDVFCYHHNIPYEEVETILKKYLKV